MKTYTPRAPGATPLTLHRPLIRAVLSRLDEWCSTDESPPREVELDRLLQPLFSLDADGAWPHMRRVGALARTLWLAAGGEQTDADWVRLFGALHDLGKLGVRQSVLARSGPLTAREWRHVQRHTVLGDKLLRGCTAPRLRTAARVAVEHHEHWDGGGYPRRLAGSAIHPAARVVAIADVYDALTTARPYRAAVPPDAALDLMRTGRGRQFDPVLFEAFESACLPCSPGPSCP